MEPGANPWLAIATACGPAPDSPHRSFSEGSPLRLVVVGVIGHVWPGAHPSAGFATAFGAGARPFRTSGSGVGAPCLP